MAPLAARTYPNQAWCQHNARLSDVGGVAGRRGGLGSDAASPTYGNLVFPGENSKLIQASDEVPARSNVASYKDAEGEDGEGVHRAQSFSLLAQHAANRGERYRSLARESRGRAGGEDISSAGGRGVERIDGAAAEEGKRQPGCFAGTDARRVNGAHRSCREMRCPSDLICREVWQISQMSLAWEAEERDAATAKLKSGSTVGGLLVFGERSCM